MLSASTVTRERGAEAFEKLATLLKQGNVELQLDGTELLSTPFLDEIVRLLASRNQVTEVTFVTDNADTVRKLQRIAAVRDVTIFGRGGKQPERAPVVPMPVAAGGTFSATKPPVDAQSHRGFP